MNRRELLKLFGVGSAIVPLAANGLLVPNVQARLIEEPKLDIQVVPQLDVANVFEALQSREIFDMEITLTGKTSGRKIHFDTRTYLTQFNVEQYAQPTSVDASSLSSRPRVEIATTWWGAKWSLQGQIVNAPQVRRWL